MADPNRIRQHESVDDDHPQIDKAAAYVLQRGNEALRLLLEAYCYAGEAQRSVWDFAVEIRSLRRVGCTGNELRWLVCKGYVDHAPETTIFGDDCRTFQRNGPGGGLRFRKRTCFVLTESGFCFARMVLRTLPQEFLPSVCTDNSETTAEIRPQWDHERQELRLGDAVVKQFKVPAVNQERILSVFEEEGWPARIDDPLPQLPDLDPKRRLHATINSLNGHQKQRLIRFTGDGSGEGVCWERIEPPAKTRSRNK